MGVKRKSRTQRKNPDARCREAPNHPIKTMNPSRSEESDFTDEGSDNCGDDGLMVSFPSKPRKPQHERLPSGSDSHSVISKTSSSGRSSIHSSSTMSGRSRRGSLHSSSSSCSAQSNSSSRSRRSEVMKKRVILAESLKKAGSYRSNASDGTSKANDHATASTSEETPSIRQENSFRITKKTSTIEEESRMADSERMASANEDCSPKSRKESISVDEGSGTDHSDDEDSESSAESETDHSGGGSSDTTESDAVSTSGGVPYPTAAKVGSSKKEVFYGWGEIPYSESNYSQEGSHYRSSQGGSSMRSNRELFAEFPDRQRCDASLTESQASKSLRKGEIEMIEDEYDPKRPWRKRPVELELDQASEKSVAMSALSASDCGTVFIDTAASKEDIQDQQESSINNHGEKNRKLSDGVVKDKVPETNSDEGGSSLKSARSSLNSDITELNDAKEALRRSAGGLVGLQRQTNRRSMQISTSSTSDFTLTTQTFRRPEPFRPGPGTPKGIISRMDSCHTLELLHNESSQVLQVPLPPNPPPRQSVRRMSSFSYASTCPSLPSIVENPLTTERERDQVDKQPSDLTIGTSESSGARMRLNSALNVEQKTSTSPHASQVEAQDLAFRETGFNCLKLDRKVSALTIDGDEDQTSTNGLRPLLRTSTSNMSTSSNSLNNEENGQMTMTPALLDDALMKQTSKQSNLYRLDETDEYQNIDDPQLLHDEEGKSHQNGSSNSFNMDPNVSDRSSLGTHGSQRMDIADSSDDEEERRPIVVNRSNSITNGIQNASNSFSHRRNICAHKCSHCCRRSRQRCGRFCCVNRWAIVAGIISTIVVAAIFAVLFVFIIPGNSDDIITSTDPNTTTTSSPAAKMGNDQVLSTKPPSPAPIERFTLWPTAVDTYKEKYPPPP